MHPEYWNFKNDIALLRLGTPVILTSKVGTVCLPKSGSRVSPGTRCWISGWGTVKFNFLGTAKPPMYLQQANVPIVDYNTCAKKSGDLVHGAKMVCTGGDGKVSCHGDNGGPLVCEEEGGWVLRGVTSGADKKCKTDHYSIYARVSNYVDWIDHQIAIAFALFVLGPVFSQGAHHIHRDGVVYRINKIIMHAGFSMSHLRDDIALLRLAVPVKLDRNVGTVCFPKSGSRVSPGTRCWISVCKDEVDSRKCYNSWMFCWDSSVYSKCQKSCGYCAWWGTERFNIWGTAKYPKYLKQANVPIMDSRTCAKKAEADSNLEVHDPTMMPVMEIMTEVRTASILGRQI
ncbi:hypothetical protein ACROYT_G029015 [Oculina patagonica]